MTKRRAKGDFGILYVATGKRYIDEAVRSATSARQVMPGIPTAIHLDDSSGLPSNLFESVTIIDNPRYESFDKIAPLTESPFEKTLFLDTDTLVIEPLKELPLLLDRFDLAYCHAPRRFERNVDFTSSHDNKAFPEGNTGVILYRSSAAVFDLFRAWSELNQKYQADRQRGGLPKRRFYDQPAFKDVVYQSKLNTTILPPEYNLRTPSPFFASGKIKILHGREPTLSKAVRSINKKTDKRIGDYRTPGQLLRQRYGKRYRKALRRITQFKRRVLKRLLP